MGKYDYNGKPYITINNVVAIKHILSFIEFEKYEKSILKLNLELANKNALIRLAQYQRNIGVNMEKEEFLRDVAFIGGSLIEIFKNNSRIYTGVVLACFDILMNRECKFEDEFITKMLKMKNYFLCNCNQNEFQSEAFYLLFKSYFRRENNK
jgi:hypothetical protein